MLVSKSQWIVLSVIISVFFAGASWAIPIADKYIGATDPKHRDVIGNADQFDIHGAEVQRINDELVVRIHTNFAGLAGGALFSSYTDDGMGIGYGDLFLAPAWNPEGAAPYLDDNHITGTTWTHAFTLDNRWNDGGGSGYLFELDPDQKASQLLLSQHFISGASYRVGQEIAVDMPSTALSADGAWGIGDSELDVDADPDFIQFIIDISSAEALKNSDTVAFHWTMTCGNDVIEGEAPNSVPEPSSMLLLGLGIIGVAGASGCRLGKTG